MKPKINTILNNIEKLENEKSELMISLKQSLALEFLIPNVFDNANITTRWRDKSLSEYHSRKLINTIKKVSYELATFDIKSNGITLASFKYNEVPEILKEQFRKGKQL